MDKASISLRKKRTVKTKISAPRNISAPKPISAPKQISAPMPTTLPVPDRSRFDQNNASATSLASSLAPSIAESITPSLNPSVAPSQNGVPNPKEKTADFVKRRYSTKAPLVVPQHEDAPALPSIPSQYANPNQGLNDRARQKVEVDLRALQNPNLDVDRYVTEILTNATEQDIRDYQHDLRGVKGRTSVGIQESVYQNRTQFIKISQEAEKLKEEMRALRTLMSDLTSTLGQTNAAMGITTDTHKSRKASNRSSVANLEAMWSTHLQELWRRVEGSQKFLPAVPGRHVVHESRRWVELNAATWKQKRRVHLVLLNDNFLVAVEKQRKDAHQTQGKSIQTSLQVERCWPLLDVQVLDLARSTLVSGASKSTRTNAANAISVRLGTDSCTYATVDADGSEKTNLMAKYRKTMSELRRVQHAEAEERGLARTSGYFGLAPNETDSRRTSTQNPSVETPALNRANMLVEVEGRQQNFRWVEVQADELDIDVALQRHEEAVNRVERLRNVGKSNKNNTLVQELVNTRVQNRAVALATALTRQLVDTNSSMVSTEQCVTWLIKLGFSARASEAYLEARKVLTQRRTSQCTHQGDLQQYLYQISFIYFTIIRNTVSIYQHCFPQVMMSACVKWAKEQVDDFNRIFNAQTSTLGADDADRKKCLELAREHAAKLSEIGLDFRSLVGYDKS